VGNAEMNSFIVIHADIEVVWSALTDENKLTQWYAPGSPWEIPELSAGQKMLFTLMPNRYNNLAEKLPMTLTIGKIDPYREFSFYVDAQQTFISFSLESQQDGIKVMANMGGYDESLANLKALTEGKELPYA
jgi:hypothetical protein